MIGVKDSIPSEPRFDTVNVPIDASALRRSDDSLALLCDLVKRKLFCVEYGGDHKTSIGVDGDTEVYCIEVSHCIVEAVSVKALHVEKYS